MFRPKINVPSFQSNRSLSINAPKRSFKVPNSIYKVSSPIFNVRGFCQTKVAEDVNEPDFPKALVDDVELHIMYMKLERTFEVLKTTDEAHQKKILENFNVSPGSSTLDWVHNYPPPVHTYEEIPIVKEVGGETGGEAGNSHGHH